MAKLQKLDFEKIKAMQARGWKPETIISKSSWSKRTVERVLGATNWNVYRSRITAETRRIANARANGTLKKAADRGEFVHSNEAGVYQDLPSMPGYKPQQQPADEDFLGRKIKTPKKKKGLLSRLLKR